jgi:hypothetical protein
MCLETLIWKTSGKATSGPPLGDQGDTSPTRICTRRVMAEKEDRHVQKDHTKEKHFTRPKKLHVCDICSENQCAWNTW